MSECQLPFESLTDNTSITFVSGKVSFKNFEGLPTLKVVVFVSPLIALTVLESL